MGQSSITHDTMLKEQIGSLLVSTVGGMKINGVPTDIGYGRSHETMVFRVDGDGRVNYSEIAFDAYSSKEEAEAGHVAMCARVRSGEVA